MKTQALKNELWIALVLASVISGTGLAYWFKVSDISTPTITTPTITLPSQAKVTAYWIEVQTKKFVAVPVKTNDSQNSQAIATLSNLITAVPPKDFYSAIPSGTRVLDYAVKDRNIYLNLSQEFTGGGGSSSMRGRVIQVLYTITSLNPDANLFLSVEGQPLKYLGGEGLELAQPLRRADFGLEF
jgi:spore germination protein GerM